MTSEQYIDAMRIDPVISMLLDCLDTDEDRKRVLAMMRIAFSDGFVDGVRTMGQRAREAIRNHG